VRRLLADAEKLKGEAVTEFEECTRRMELVKSRDAIAQGLRKKVDEIGRIKKEVRTIEDEVAKLNTDLMAEGGTSTADELNQQMEETQRAMLVSDSILPGAEPF
jgi:predicted RNase H-like nuclease (RuvC/YqgF family)